MPNCNFCGGPEGSGAAISFEPILGTASTAAHVGLRLLGYKRFVRGRVWKQERHRFLPPRLVLELSRLVVPGVRRLS